MMPNIILKTLKISGKLDRLKFQRQRLEDRGKNLVLTKKLDFEIATLLN